jgi:hypothetical protein
MFGLVATAAMTYAANVSAPTDYYGVDVSVPVSESEFACLKAANLRFAIVRCYRSTGSIDTACAASIAAAHAGSMDSVHAYMFPHPKGGDAKGQVGDLLDYFKAHSVDVQRLWLDIEGEQYWLGSATSNQAFYRDLADACSSYKLACGVYSSKVQWEAIFGSSSFSYGADLPLWYAHYDKAASFSDFSAFAGWSAPTIKQFSDAGAKCGTSYDISWAPSLPQ